MQVTLPNEMLEDLKKISGESGNPIASIIRIAIAEYLKKKRLDKWL